NLHVLAAANGSKLGHARDLGGEADAARALDAAVHRGLDQSPEILVLDGALVLLETRGIDAISHCLILQIAFAALVADRTIERVIDEQELHHAFAGLADHRRPGLDLRELALRSRTAIAHRPGATRDRFRGPGKFDQAHAAVAGDREPLVETEARNLCA